MAWYLNKDRVTLPLPHLCTVSLNQTGRRGWGEKCLVSSVVIFWGIFAQST
jgi:hypothetical protein